MNQGRPNSKRHHLLAGLPHVSEVSKEAVEGLRKFYPGMFDRLKPGDTAYERVTALRANGIEACDAVEHNSSNGCPNPNCFNHRPRNETTP